MKEEQCYARLSLALDEYLKYRLPYAQTYRRSGDVRRRIALEKADYDPSSDFSSITEYRRRRAEGASPTRCLVCRRVLAGSRPFFSSSSSSLAAQCQACGHVSHAECLKEWACCFRRSPRPSPGPTTHGGDRVEEGGEFRCPAPGCTCKCVDVGGGGVVVVG